MSAKQPRAPPKGVWIADRAADVEADAVVATLVPTRSFRRDVLAYCTLSGLVPHPKLLPPHADEEEARGAEDATSGANVYDLSDVDRVAVRHWRLDAGSCRALCFALPHAARLRSLCLFDVGLGAEQLALVCRAVPQSQLQSLQLDWNPLPSSGREGREADGAAETEGETVDERVFADALADGSRLVLLSLRASGMGERGAAALASRLRENATLEALNLFGNRLGDAGALELARALPFNSTLRTLSLADNDVSGRGLQALVDAVTKYEAPPEVHELLRAAESRIQAQLDAAKKAKKKMDRPAAIAALGLPVLEPDGDSDRWLAPGNATLQELVLSGNVRISERDARQAGTQLDAHADKLRAHLRRIALQRLSLPCAPPISEFLSV